MDGHNLVRRTKSDFHRRWLFDMNTSIIGVQAAYGNPR